MDARGGDRVFIITIVAAFVVKLWLTSGTRIVALYALYDNSNFVVHAANIAMGRWFGPYDQYALIKQPFFPMYMAGLQEFGLPLPVAHVIFYGLACFVACFAVKPIVRSALVRAAMFIVLYFNPVENDIYAWYTTRSQVNPTVALLALSCAIGLFVRRRDGAGVQVRWAVALGLSFGAFWLTREEAIWMVPALAVLLCGYLYHPLREREATETRARSLTAGLALATWAAVPGTVMLLNGYYYGWYTTAENLAPELQSAWASLARIDPGTPPIRGVQVPHAALLIAYRISPAARELEPAMEGAQGAFWARSDCQDSRGCTNIKGNFIWALRDAVSHAGHYVSGAAAREFYLRLANEIDAACSAHRIACRPKRQSLAPPIEVTDIPAIVANAVAATQLTLSFAGLRFEPNPDPSSEVVRPDYDFITRSVDDGFPNEPTAKDDPLKRTILAGISQLYQLAVRTWVSLALLAIGIRCASLLLKRPQNISVEYLLIAASLAVAFLTLIVLFAVITTVAFSTVNPDYMSPLYVVLISTVVLVTAVEGPAWLLFFYKRDPSPKAIT